MTGASLMNTTDEWARFRERILEGTQQVEMIKAWDQIAELTRLPQAEAADKLRKLIIDQMDETAFVTFRNAMILVNNTYSRRAGIANVQDPAEWQRRYMAYLNGPDAEARQYENYWNLRGAMEQLRKPKDQSPAYNQEELDFAAKCNALFNSLAPILIKSSPGSASPELADDLAAIIAKYQDLVANAKPQWRTRRQALEAIAQATYALGRVHLILKDYNRATLEFRKALDQFEALNDSFNAQACRQQLAALSTLGGNIDEAMRANLEALTSEKGQGRSLARAAAFIDQLKRTLDTGDQFEARQLLNSAVRELNSQLYPDPHRTGVTECFKSWVEMVPANLRGTDFMNELAQVIRLYSATLGARAILDSNAQAEQQLRALADLATRMGEEALKADADLQRRFMDADARPLLAGAAGSAQ